MIPPTFDEVKVWTNLAELQAMDETAGSRVVARAVAMVARITGITFSSLPVEQEPLAEQAVQGLSESITFDQSGDMLETLSDFALIQSFTAGPYSETRRSPADMMKARLLHPWPWLSEVLWMLMTDDRFDYWWHYFGGPNAPASEVVEVDWSGGADQGGGVPYGGISRLDPWSDS